MSSVQLTELYPLIRVAKLPRKGKSQWQRLIPFSASLGFQSVVCAGQISDVKVEPPPLRLLVGSCFTKKGNSFRYSRLRKKMAMLYPFCSSSSSRKHLNAFLITAVTGDILGQSE